MGGKQGFSVAGQRCGRRRIDRLAAGLDMQRIDHQSCCRVRRQGRAETEPRPVCELERCGNLGRGPERHLERRVRAPVPDGKAAGHLDPIGRYARGGHGVDGSGRSSSQSPVQIVNECGVQGCFDGLSAQLGHIGKPDAQRREHACVRVDEDRGDAEPVCYPAGMLAAGTAETHERVGGDVVAALGADLADRVGHVLGCDLAVAKRHLGGTASRAARARDPVG